MYDLLFFQREEFRQPVEQQEIPVQLFRKSEHCRCMVIQPCGPVIDDE